MFEGGLAVNTFAFRARLELGFESGGWQDWLLQMISAAMWLEIKSMHQRSDGGRTSMGIVGERVHITRVYIGWHGS